MATIQPSLLSALAELPKLQSLSVFCNRENQNRHDNVLGLDAMNAICKLTSLRSLKGRWNLTTPKLQQLASSLPFLEVLGFGACIAGWEAAGGDEAEEPAIFPHVHTLTGPPSYEEDAGKKPILSGEWFLAGYTCQLSVETLLRFPALKHLQRCNVYMDPSAPPQALAAAAALMASQPASPGVASWGMATGLVGDDSAAVAAAAGGPGCWQHVQHLQVFVDRADLEDLGLGYIGASLLAICESATNLQTLDLAMQGDKEQCPVIEVIGAVLPAVARLPKLVNMLFNVGGADYDQYERLQLVLGLAAGFPRPPSIGIADGKGKSKARGTQQLWLSFWDEDLEAAWNRGFAALGSGVRVRSAHEL